MANSELNIAGGRIDTKVGGAASVGEDGDRICWICYEDDRGAVQDWLSPCKCQGSVQWVHRVCLEYLIDHKQDGNTEEPVHCARCTYRYDISYPRPQCLEMVARYLDDTSNAMCKIDWNMDGVGAIIMGSVFTNILIAIVNLWDVQPLGTFLSTLNPVITNTVMMILIVLFQRNRVVLDFVQQRIIANLNELEHRGVVTFHAITWTIGEVLLRKIKSRNLRLLASGIVYITFKYTLRTFLHKQLNHRKKYRIVHSYHKEIVTPGALPHDNSLLILNVHDNTFGAAANASQEIGAEPEVCHGPESYAASGVGTDQGTIGDQKTDAEKDIHAYQGGKTEEGLDAGKEAEVEQGMDYGQDTIGDQKTEAEKDFDAYQGGKTEEGLDAGKEAEVEQGMDYGQGTIGDQKTEAEKDIDAYQGGKAEERIDAGKEAEVEQGMDYGQGTIGDQKIEAEKDIHAYQGGKAEERIDAGKEAEVEQGTNGDQETEAAYQGDNAVEGIDAGQGVKDGQEALAEEGQEVKNGEDVKDELYIGDCSDVKEQQIGGAKHSEGGQNNQDRHDGNGDRMAANQKATDGQDLEPECIGDQIGENN